MKTQWFKEYLQSHLPRNFWRRSELNDAAEILMEISKLNAGEVEKGKKISESEEKIFAVKRVEHVLERRFVLYARGIAAYLDYPFYSHKSSIQPKDLPDYLELQDLRARINLNLASLDELVALPGLGPVTAQRIIDRRNRHGSFSDITDIQMVTGVDKNDFEKLKNFIMVGEIVDTFSSSLKNDLIMKFVISPSLPSYFELIRNTNGYFLEAQKYALSLGEKLIIELKSIKQELEQTQFPFFKLVNITSQNSVEALNKIDMAVQESQTYKANNALGALLFDNQYFNFLENLIICSEKSIRVIMFFMRYEDEQSYPTDAVINSLVGAHDRKVDVKVILDKDAEGDVYGSRVINAEVYEMFREKGIPVTYDNEDRVTHTKAVIVDDRHVVIGSHNWTGGSFWAYDDVSVYIYSEKLAKFYNDDFDRRWQQYQKI